MSRGRHRRPRSPLISRHVSRVSLALTAGGAGITLPLVAAGSANAAPVSVWDKVAECESNGDWSINTGNGYYGGLQFSQSSWEAAGGTQYAARADQASKDQQITAAEKLLEMQGPGAWPVCGPQAGLSKNSGSPDVNPGGEAQPKQQAAPKTQPKTQPKSKPAESAPAPKAERQAEQPKKKAAPQATDAKYTVVSGDTLHGIATAKQVDGGWETVYEANRETVGGDPDLIFPGQVLTLAEAKGKAPSTETKPKTEAKPQKQERKAEKPEQTEQKAEAPAPAKKSAEKAATNAGGFTTPVDAGVSTSYRASGSMWGSGYHTGVDFSAPSGSPVKAVSAGTVVSAGWSGSYGNEVVIKHSDGHYSQYAHLSSLGVQSGQSVGAGDQIGLVGSTGNSTGPHLHFEVRTGPSYGSDIDPLSYLRSKGVSL